MRTDLIRKNNERSKEYFTRAAAIIAGLKAEGKESEAAECLSEVYGSLYDIIEEVVECESRKYRLDENTRLRYSDNVHDIVVEDFYKFNNPKFLKDSSKQYEIKTFIKNRTRCCLRTAIADSLGISQNACRVLFKVREIRADISKEKGISEGMVTADMIHERIGEGISKGLIVDLLNMEKGHVSLTEMQENGEQMGAEDDIDPSVYGTDISDDCKSVLDEASAKLSDLDIYILMKEFGLLGEELQKQDMCDFVISATFQKLYDADDKIRSKNDPVKTAYNKKSKIMKVLAEMNGKINMADVEGCLVSYFMKRWEQISK